MSIAKRPARLLDHSIDDIVSLQMVHQVGLSAHGAGEQAATGACKLYTSRPRSAGVSPGCSRRPSNRKRRLATATDLFWA